MHKVAVILINYKDYAKRFLPACVESLRKVEFASGEFRIFIVDNETSEETRKYIAEVSPEAVIIPCETNSGYAGGNNIGMREAKKWGADYFYLLNMDTEVDKSFLEEAIKVYESDPQVGLVQSRIMLFSDKEKINSVGNKLHFLGFGYCEGYGEKHQNKIKNSEREIRNSWFESPSLRQAQGKLLRVTFRTMTNSDLEFHDVVYPSGAGVLISAQKLERIGYFTDELFMYLEDAEWGWKSRLYGFKNLVALNSVVYHKYEFSRSVTKMYWLERNRIILTLMCYRWLTLVVLFPAWLAMEAGLLIFSLRGGWFSDKIKSYKWFLDLHNLKMLLKWRDEVDARRVKADWGVVRDFTGKIEFQEVSGGGKLLRFANVFFNLYWQIAKRLLIW